MTKAALQAAYVVSEDLGTSLAERLFTSPRRYRRPERERGVLASGWRFTVDVTLRSPTWRGGRRKVTAWRWGHGPTVLLVHGWEGRGSQLGAFVEPLVRAGLSVVAFDAPGHGDSPGRRLYLTDLADCVVDVARAVGPLHAIVAHSFGAAAVLLAHRRGAVDETAPPFGAAAGPGAPSVDGTAPPFGAAAGRGAPTVDATAPPFGAAAGRGAPTVDARRYVMLAPNVLIDQAVAQFARAVALDDQDRASLEGQLASHSGVPVAALRLEALVGARDAALLVIHDRDDREVPFVHGERLAAAWRQATLHATAGLGHRRVLREPAVIDEVVSFVRHGVAPPASELVREVDRLLEPSGL